MTRLVQELIVSGVTLLASIIVAVVASRIITSLATKFDRKETDLMDDVLRAFRRPVAGMIVIAGIYGSLSSLSYTKNYIQSLEKWFVAAATLLFVSALAQAASIGIRWYVRSFGDPTLAGHESVYRKIAMLAIWLFAFVLVLDQLGYKITTIVAGLGIAGLAVGLALQDTIANLFSGFYLMVDRSVRPGDYIKLDTGDEGFVEYVGWRNTKIRVWANNIVLIPNAKLIQSVITNYTLPEKALSVYVSCGVSYDSDLEHVEKVSLDVAKEVISRVPDSDTTFEPVVRFKEFGETRISFVVVMRSLDVGGQYLLHHEFVKALHRRFAEEGIMTAYPLGKYVCDGLLTNKRTAELQ